MEILSNDTFTIEEVIVKEEKDAVKSATIEKSEELKKKEIHDHYALPTDLKIHGEKIERPEMVDAKVYKLKSRFVKESLYITLSYITDDNGKNRPIEIFINSKDLSKLPEYTMLTRLISAIFRNFRDPKFLLEEMQGVYDPEGGYFQKGKYIYSFYSEIANIIERFFMDIGFIAGKDGALDNWIETAKKANPEKEFEVNKFKICPECNQKSLQLDGGCLMCINPECGYSKCS